MGAIATGCTVPAARDSLCGVLLPWPVVLVAAEGSVPRRGCWYVVTAAIGRVGVEDPAGCRRP